MNASTIRTSFGISLVFLDVDVGEFIQINSRLAPGRHGVESAFVERVTAAETLQAKPHAPPGSMLRDRFTHVVRAGGVKTACRGKERRNQSLVRADESAKDRARCPGNPASLHRKKRRCTSACSSLNKQSRALRRGLKTIDHSGLSWASSRRAASRTRRRIRFRTTAVPERPRRRRNRPVWGQGNPASTGKRPRNTGTHGAPRGRKPFGTRSIVGFGHSWENPILSLRFDQNFAGSDYLSELTLSFLRPAARRRDRTACPSAVFIRVRKPCVLARLPVVRLKCTFRHGILFL